MSVAALFKFNFSFRDVLFFAIRYSVMIWGLAGVAYRVNDGVTILMWEALGWAGASLILFALTQWANDRLVIPLWFRVLIFVVLAFGLITAPVALLHAVFQLKGGQPGQYSYVCLTC